MSPEPPLRPRTAAIRRTGRTGCRGGDLALPMAPPNPPAHPPPPRPAPQAPQKAAFVALAAFAAAALISAAPVEAAEVKATICASNPTAKLCLKNSAIKQ
jgi:hypothetical protein